MARTDERLKRWFLRFHKLGLRFGLQILPSHYYSPVPDLRELERTRERWASASELPGIEVDLDAQLDRLRSTCSPYEHEFRGNATFREGVAIGPGFGYVEAQALHGFVRHWKPRRIIEVGCGVSTLCMLRALERNAAEGAPPARLVAIEPHPRASLRTMAGLELLERPVQEVPLDVFTALRDNDFLFVDSSHTVKPGGDVNYLVLEVLPRLGPGVLVHFHDINFPFDYQRDLDQTFLFWSEGSLLRAYLTFNPRVRILVSLSLLHYRRREDLRRVFPEYEPQADRDGMRGDGAPAFVERASHFPSSLYLLTC